MFKNYLSGIILIFLTIGNVSAQIVFEEGYIVNNFDEKIKCLIKNVDWNKNPDEFLYKLTNESEVLTGTIENIKEFGISSSATKHIRATVKIDQSLNEISYLTNSRNPLYKTETVFLKVLIEGKASLYVYVFGNEIRFFFSSSNYSYEPLVYKKYLNGKNVLENDTYKQQLLNTLTCSNLENVKFETLKYRRKDLERIFSLYITCVQATFVSYVPHKESKWLNFSVRPGISYQKISIDNLTLPSENIDFKAEPGVRLGLEFEFILPYNKNKWSIILEPTYRSYSSDETELNSQNNNKRSVTYNSIEIPVGLRHYFYLPNKTAFFCNASYVFDLPVNSEISFFNANGVKADELELASRSNLFIGVGYKIPKNFSFELRYSTNRNILANYLYWKSAHSAVSLIIGYKLF
jgi:hypothetical protein